MSLNLYNRGLSQMGSLAAGSQSSGFDSRPGSPTCQGPYLKPMKNPNPPHSQELEGTGLGLSIFPLSPNLFPFPKQPNQTQLYSLHSSQSPAEDALVPSTLKHLGSELGA